MRGPKTIFERDNQINSTIEGIVKIARKKKLETDRRGQWFANSQLDNLRKLLEIKGYKTARVFQTGKIEKRDNRWEIARNEALLEILDLLGKSNLEVTICSYILGKLNSLINEALKQEGKHE